MESTSPVYKYVGHVPPPAGKGTMGGALSSGSIGVLIFLAAFLTLNGLLFLMLTSAKREKELTRGVLDQKLTELTNGDAQMIIAEGTALQTQIQEYVKALDSRFLWSKLLTHLQAATYTKAKYNSFTVNKDGSIRIDGETNSFSDVAKAYVALRDYTVDGQPGFDEVKLSSVAVTPATKEGESAKATFSIVLKVPLTVLRDPRAPQVEGALQATPIGTSTVTP